MLSFQSLMDENSEHPAARGYFVRSVAVNANDFRYGDCRELELANVWSIPSRGIIAVCCEGCRPVDEDAVSLSAIAYNATQLGKAIGDVAFAVGGRELSSGVAVVTRSPQKEMSQRQIIGSVGVDLAPGKRESSLPFQEEFAPLVVHVKLIEDAKPNEDENEPEKKPEPYDPSALYEPYGPVANAVPMAAAELWDIFDDTASVVIVTGCAASAVLSLPHRQSDRLTLPLDDSCLTDETLEHAMWHLANTIQRGKVGQWLIGLSAVGQGLQPLVAELWNCNVPFSVYVATLAHDGLHVRRLLIEEKLARAWLTATCGDKRENA